MLVLTLVVQACGHSPAGTLASSRASTRVTGMYFGMHAPGLDTAWPHASVGAVNLTTNNVYWPQLQTAPGAAGFLDFARLDALVEDAHAHGAQPVLVLGQTPAFASTDATNSNVAGTVPTMAAWQEYVQAVVDEYHTTIDYQIWPEANAAANWLGTQPQLARLVVAAAKIIHTSAPGAVVVSPRWWPGCPTR